MGTRCGDIDPAIVPFIMDKEGLSANDVNNVMNKKSGFLGITGYSSDSRDVENAIIAGPTDPNYEKAVLAVEMLKHQLKKFIGGYAAIMNGLDAVVFTAGIGENSSLLRARVCADMEYLGIEIDEAANEKAFRLSSSAKISKDGSKVDVYVIPTNEELVIAQDTAAIVSAL
jgi:acetate kinase